MLIGWFCKVIPVCWYSATHISTHLQTNLSTAPKCVFLCLLLLTVWQLSPASAAGLLLLSSRTVSGLRWWGYSGWEHGSTTTNILAAGCNPTLHVGPAVCNAIAAKGHAVPAQEDAQTGCAMQPSRQPSHAPQDAPRTAIFLSRAPLVSPPYTFSLWAGVCSHGCTTRCGQCLLPQYGWQVGQ